MPTVDAYPSSVHLKVTPTDVDNIQIIKACAAMTAKAANGVGPKTILSDGIRQKLCSDANLNITPNSPGESSVPIFTTDGAVKIATVVERHGSTMDQLREDAAVLSKKLEKSFTVTRAEIKMMASVAIIVATVAGRGNRPTQPCGMETLQTADAKTGGAIKNFEEDSLSFVAIIYP